MGYMREASIKKWESVQDCLLKTSTNMSDSRLATHYDDGSVLCKASEYYSSFFGGGLEASTSFSYIKNMGVFLITLWTILKQFFNGFKLVPENMTDCGL